ncbi:MAG: hypothetical protein K6F61_12120 [Clostridiales bacterium]|nr:hypothetical protein [Clostridiales bacterium]
MKPLGIILIILVLAAFIGAGYLYLNANLDIRFEACIATDGITQVDYFNTLKSKVASSAFVGTRFTNSDLGSADQYQFLTYTVHLDNHTFLKAEVIEVRITPMQGDVLQIGEEAVHDLPSGQQMDLSSTILTDRTMHSVREATVSYYFWGIPLTTSLTLGR